MAVLAVQYLTPIPTVAQPELHLVRRAGEASLLRPLRITATATLETLVQGVIYHPILMSSGVKKTKNARVI